MDWLAVAIEIVWPWATMGALLGCRSFAIIAGLDTAMRCSVLIFPKKFSCACDG